MTFSATDAAFEGFKVVRRKPMSLIFWSLAYLVFLGLAFLLFGGSIVSMMALSANMQTGAEPDMAQLEALGPVYAGLFLLGAPLAILFSAVLSTAVARSVLKPAESAFGYMRLGKDELRVLLVTVVLSIVMFVVTFVCFVLLGILAGVISATGQNILWLVVVLLGLGSVGLIVWLSVRLSLAVPITVAERRIAIFDSFALTKGKSFPLLGMAIIAFIMTMLVSILSSIIAWPVTLATGSLESLAAYEGEPTWELLRLGAPAIIGWVVLNAIFSALQLAVLYAPFSAAYRDLKGLPVEGLPVEGAKVEG